MSKKRLDRRAQRSRRQLQAALFEILQKKPYRKITVVDIVERADVARPTFYLHFETKDHLLVSYLDGVLEGYYEDLLAQLMNPESLIADPYMKAVKYMFETWCQHAPFFRQLHRVEVDHLFMPLFRKYHRRLFFDFVQTDQTTDLDPTLLEYVIEYAAGALYMLLMRWTDEGMPHSADVMASLLVDLEQQGFIRMFFGAQPMLSLNSRQEIDDMHLPERHSWL